MTYVKPEVNVLGSANTLIEKTNGKIDSTHDAGPQDPNPAYDLDD